MWCSVLLINADCLSNGAIFSLWAVMVTWQKRTEIDCMFLSVVRTIFLVDVPGGPPLKSDRGAHRLALGCKLHILVSLRVFAWKVTTQWLPITRTFRGNRNRFELSGVRVFGSLKKIARDEKKNSFYCIVNILITFI